MAPELKLRTGPAAAAAAGDDAAAPAGDQDSAIVACPNWKPSFRPNSNPIRCSRSSRSAALPRPRRTTGWPTTTTPCRSDPDLFRRARGRARRPPSQNGMNADEQPKVQVMTSEARDAALEMQAVRPPRQARLARVPGELLQQLAGQPSLPIPTTSAARPSRTRSPARLRSKTI